VVLLDLVPLLQNGFVDFVLGVELDHCVEVDLLREELGLFGILKSDVLEDDAAAHVGEQTLVNLEEGFPEGFFLVAVPLVGVLQEQPGKVLRGEVADDVAAVSVEYRK